MSGLERGDLVRLWEELEARHVPNNLGNLVSVDLGHLYERLRGADRAAFESLLIERISSDDPGERFTALAVVDDQRIVSAIPALRVLADQFEHARGPAAPYDWAKVNRILASLTEQDAAPGATGESGE